LKTNRYNSIKGIEVEKNFNLMYVTVNPSISKGIVMAKSELDTQRITNLGIYNLNTSELTYLFKQGANQELRTLLFESCYDEDKKRIEFNNESNHLINNRSIANREISNLLFLVREGKKTGEFEFWKSTKDGQEKELIRTFNNDEIWRLDVKNRKLIFIEKLSDQLNVNEYEW